MAENCYCAFCAKGYQDPNFANFIGALERVNLVHIFVGELIVRDPPEKCECGQPREQQWLDIPTPGGDPRTPIVGHPGEGCIGPWIHNKKMMRFHGLEPKPLPCSDSFCNSCWEGIERPDKTSSRTRPAMERATGAAPAT